MTYFANSEKTADRTRFSRDLILSVITFATILFTLYLAMGFSLRFTTSQPQGAAESRNAGQSVSAKTLAPATRVSAGYLTQVNAVNVLAGNPSPITLTGKGVVIGIYDGGVNLDHPALKENGVSRIISQECVGSSDDVNPCNKQQGREAQNYCTSMVVGCFHGMSVAGFAAGNQTSVNLNGHDTGVGGVATEAKISYVRDAMSSSGSIKYDDFVSALDKFVDDVKNHSPAAPNVVNLSLSFPRDSYTNCDEDNDVKRNIDYLTNAGVVVVSATGNDGDKSKITYPACMSNVLAVGSTHIATNSDGSTTETVSDFSDMGNNVSLVAPGEDIWGLVPDPSRYATVSGTSFAAPLVSGAVALIKQAKPGLNVTQIKDLLVSTGDVVIDPATNKTYRRLNVGNAIAKINPVVSPAVKIVTTPADNATSAEGDASSAVPSSDSDHNASPVLPLRSPRFARSAASVKENVPTAGLIVGGALLIGIALMWGVLRIRREMESNDRVFKDIARRRKRDI